MNTKIKFLGKEFKNPIIPASGTFGFGYEFAELYDINCLGSISVKGTTLNPRYGNPLPRIAECQAGLINSIGLQNPGVDKVISEELPKLDKVYSDQIIANVGGHSQFEYVETCKRLSKCDKVFAIELNISCPNVTDIVKMAKAVEEAGADAISLINTLVGMRISLRTGQPIIAVKKGGYSGPGIFPVALRMVYEVSHAVSIPVIGMGGISNAYEVLEMMMAGASLVMIGSENLVNPYACRDIINDLPRVMNEFNIDDLNTIIGKAK